MFNLGARMICGASNLQAKSGVENILHERSFHYVPPYIAKCGEVFCGSIRKFGVNFSCFQDIMLTGFQSRVCRLVDEAIKRQRPPLLIADEITLRRSQRIKMNAERNPFNGRIWKLGRWADCRIWVPMFVKRRIAKRHVMICVNE